MPTKEPPPTKEQVRKFMQERQKAPRTPPPAPAEIRRMLGPGPTTKTRG